MTKCNDPIFEHMFHAHELGMLSDTERAKLEMHLMECESCFQKSLELKEAVAIINKDNDAKNVVTNIVKNKDTTQSLAKKMLNWMWSPIPPYAMTRYLKVAAILLIIILPLYKFAFQTTTTTKYTLDLYPLRDVENNVLVLDNIGEVIINFIYEDAETNTSYRIDLTSREGLIIYSDSSFSEFSKSGLGNIVISSAKFDAGYYTFKIVDIQNGSSVIVQEYYFKVE